MGNRGQLKEPGTTWETVNTRYEEAEKAVRDAADPEKKKDAERVVLLQKPLYEAMKNVHAATQDVQRRQAAVDSSATGTDETLKSTNKKALEDAEEKLAKLKDAAAREESAGLAKGEQELEVKKALMDIYTYQKQLREANEAANKANEAGNRADQAENQAKAEGARSNLEVAKTRLRNANEVLQAIGTKESVASLEVDGIKTMKTVVKGHLTSIDGEINDLQIQLGSTGAGLANAPNVITGVTKDRALIYANDDASKQTGSASAALGEESADVWTNISFSVGTESDSSSTKESHVSGSANVSVGRWWATVQASSSFSSSSKKVQSQMSSCRVDGSFSAMVVNIKRPWLHGDLFQDFDIDIPTGTKLSPGAAQIKEWVDKGDPETGANKRTEYGKFPAYPTAFIVAADTVLEFKSTQKNSEEMMQSLSTDSSIQASYGPWGLTGGVSAKTNSQESAQKLEVKDGSLRIAFQAPQIIGWVSEILPQLPRSANMGGLVAPPNTAFRV